MFRIIFHLDMDAFYASVEQRDDPALRGKPVIVGSPPTQRGVVCAASYEARKFGVRSAMPSITAARLCPKGIFVRPRMEHYREESRQIMALVAQSGALIEQVSIDEAYLDLSEVVGKASSLTAETNAIETGGTSVPGDPDDFLLQAVPLAKQLKQRIQTERGLTASIGIAANKLLAKLASDFNKPNGLTLVPERDKIPFLRPMPVRAIHGIGKVTEQVLNRAGIGTVGDLQDYHGDLRALVGSFGPKLKQFALGEDDRPLEIGDEVKSISSEETFLKDTDERPVLRKCLREQATEISGKLKRRRLAAKTVQVKLRYGDFTTLTRQITVEGPISEPEEIYRLGCFLLAKEKLVSRPLRLLGLGVSGLDEAAVRQLLLL
jgi:DNA polymerase-4